VTRTYNIRAVIFVISVWWRSFYANVDTKQALQGRGDRTLFMGTSSYVDWVRLSSKGWPDMCRNTEGEIPIATYIDSIENKSITG